MFRMIAMVGTALIGAAVMAQELPPAAPRSSTMPSAERLFEGMEEIIGLDGWRWTYKDITPADYSLLFYGVGSDIKDRLSDALTGAALLTSTKGSLPDLKISAVSVYLVREGVPPEEFLAALREGLEHSMNRRSRAEADKRMFVDVAGLPADRALTCPAGEGNNQGARTLCQRGSLVIAVLDGWDLDAARQKRLVELLNERIDTAAMNPPAPGGAEHSPALNPPPRGQLDPAALLFAGASNLVPGEGWQWEPMDFEPADFRRVMLMASDESKKRVRDALADVSSLSGFRTVNKTVESITLTIYLAREEASPAAFFDDILRGMDEGGDSARALGGRVTSFLDVEGLPAERAVTRQIELRDRKVRTLLYLHGRAVYEIATDGWLMDKDLRLRVVTFLNEQMDLLPPLKENEERDTADR